MGAQPPDALASDEELHFYRAVEDAFAALRGTIFVFNPRDFALLQGWWRSGVPLGAVMAGLGEVFERARQRDADPPSSLTYCRHAVHRHAKRLAAAHVGGEMPGAVRPAGPALAALAAAVRDARAAWDAQQAVACALESLAQAIEGLPADAPPAALEATLEQLEGAALEALLAALPPGEREAVQRAAGAGAPEAGVSAEVAERSRRALQARAVRERLGLPRLELDHG
ncbi:MAG: hypothetical protein MUF10_05645 [Thermoanaerobaculaceae bacterium]|jgi:hypothetical protein|nr:hypothetical protein [Thermoanaerobaculaceae bacterium]